MVLKNFKEIERLPNRYINKQGEIYSESSKKFLKYQEDKDGYFYINSTGRGIKTTHRIHRLVAETFINNPENKPQVNHIDGNRKNNHVDNLEWCTQSENIQHSYNIGLKNGPTYWKGKKGKLHPNSKKLGQYDLNNNLIKTWDNAKEVNRKLGFNSNNISMVCREERKTAHGYKWRYL